MATGKFIPALWSAKILDNLEKQLVYSRLYNTDYEGEIRDAGDTVHIGQIGEVTIRDYTKGSAIADPDEVSVTDATLLIDQAKYFNFAVDDVDAAQSRINLVDGATRRAAYGFSDVCDQYLGKQLATAGTAVSGLGTNTAPLAVTEDNAYEVLVKLKTALDKANLPTQGRAVVVPPEFVGFLLLDQRFVRATDKGDQAVAEGVAGRAAGFDVLESNNAPAGGTGFKVIASAPEQGTFAQQVLKTEAYRPDSSFSDAVKGLHVYGAKVLRPEAVAVATVSF